MNDTTIINKLENLKKLREERWWLFWKRDLLEK